MSTTTPILQLDELDPSQSQPELIVNPAIRALEVFGQIVAISREDPTDSPFTPADGDVYLVPQGTTIDEWISHENEVAYYAAGWYFLTPRAGWIAFVSDEDVYLRFGSDSPHEWVALTLPAGDAHSLPYESQASPGAPDSGIDTIGDALDDVYEQLSGASSSDAYDIDYVSSASPGPDVGVDKVGDALDELYGLIEILTDLHLGTDVAALKAFGIPLSIPGKPGAAAIYHIMTPVAFRLPASLTGSQSYSGTNATSTATFTFKRNGVSIGTAAFGSGSSTASLTFSAAIDFATGDRLTIEAPASQDGTLANVSISLKATRI